MPRIAMAATLAVLAGLTAPFPAAAQGEGERVNQLIVYGDDPCPQSTEDQITVCARKDESERFRIPEPLRDIDSPQNDAWNNRVVAYETVGKTGVLSCSPVGPGGSTGCLNKLIDKAYAQKGVNSQFSDLIASEREKRLSTIDAEAAATQARVEEAEREYAARKKAQNAAQAAPDDSSQVPASSQTPAAGGTSEPVIQPVPVP